MTKNVPGGPDVPPVPPVRTSRRLATESFQTPNFFSSYTVNKSGRVADVDCGVVVGPHLNPLPYSVFDNYATQDRTSTYYRNTIRKLEDPRIMYWNPTANTGSLDIWQTGLGFKTVVPQNESLWCKNPWFFANGEATEWVGTTPEPGNVSAQLSLNEDGHATHTRLGPKNNYHNNARNYVDRMFA